MLKDCFITDYPNCQTCQTEYMPLSEIAVLYPMFPERPDHRWVRAVESCVDKVVTCGAAGGLTVSSLCAANEARVWWWDEA